MFYDWIYAAVRAMVSSAAPTTQEEKVDVTCNLFRIDDDADIQEGYLKYYPKGLQFSNTGGLHLIPPQLVTWAIELGIQSPEERQSRCSSGQGQQRDWKRQSGECVLGGLGCRRSEAILEATEGGRWG
jgi:hypothetical protein